MRYVILLSGTALLAACAPAPQSAREEASTSTESRAGYVAGGGEISSTVYATWFGERQANTVDLLLLVLWRGAPGWTDAPQGGSARLPPHRSGTPARNQEPARFSLVERTRIGAVQLAVRLDPSSRIARVLGDELILEDRNVVLVDGVDRTGGTPRVLRVLRIDSQLPLVRRRTPEGMESKCTALSLADSTRAADSVTCEGVRTAMPHVDIRTIIQRSPELRAFVR